MYRTSPYFFNSFFPINLKLFFFFFFNKLNSPSLSCQGMVRLRSLRPGRRDPGKSGCDGTPAFADAVSPFENKSES